MSDLLRKKLEKQRSSGAKRPQGKLGVRRIKDDDGRAATDGANQAGICAVGTGAGAPAKRPSHDTPLVWEETSPFKGSNETVREACLVAGR